jgi:stearoyl-CoA desaturase (delta-9 desaturase)
MVSLEEHPHPTRSSPPKPPSTLEMSSVPTRRSASPSEDSPVPTLPVKKSLDDKPVDLNLPDNYVAHTLRNQKALPPITWNNWWKEINTLTFAILTLTPAIAIYGAFTVKLQWQTAVWSVVYYFITGLGAYLNTPCFDRNVYIRCI